MHLWRDRTLQKLETVITIKVSTAHPSVEVGNRMGITGTGHVTELLVSPDVLWHVSYL